MATKTGMHIDSSLFQAKARKLLKAVGKSEKDFVKEQGQQYALDMAKATPPHAGGRIKLGSLGTKADQRQGQSAILQDMGKVFKIREKGYLQFIERRAGTRNNIHLQLRNKSGQQYRVQVDEINYSHPRRAIRHLKSARGFNGRVPGGPPAIWTGTGVMWITREIYETVYHDAAADVGYAKAGLVKAAQRLGWRGRAAKWIKRHLPRVSAYASLSKDRSGWRASFRSTAPGYQHTRKQATFLARLRRGKALRSLEALQRNLHKKWKR